LVSLQFSTDEIIHKNC